MPPLAIPATLHDSLMARLDRLATVKAVAQLGAVLGRTFAYEVLQAVTPLDEASLQQALARLVDAELLYQRGVPPQATYLFKHALIQDAAYQSLLKSTRQQYHQRIAQVLETRFPASVETQPELVAQHYTAAGCAEQAVPYWQRAGQHASDRSAYLEAISHFTTGIELLKTLPETPERTQQALTLHIALGAALQMTKGHRSARGGARLHPGTTRCVSRWARRQSLVPVLFGLWRFYVARPQLHTARELGETLLRLAQQCPRPRARGHRPLCPWGDVVLPWRVACCPPASGGRHCTLHARPAPCSGVPHGPRSGCCLPSLCRCGPSGCWGTRSKPWPASTRPWRWRTSCRIPIVWRLRGVGQPSSRSFAGTCRPCTSTQRPPSRSRPSRAFHSGRPWERACVGGRWPCRARARREWPRSARGSPPGGPPGQQLSVPYLCTLLAEVSAHLGHTEDGLQALAEAHTLVEQHEERWWEAEVHRLRGVLLLRQPGTPQAEAEAWLQRALDVARRQEAKSLELRAAMSLARLWQQQGKRAEAYELLAPIYGWFTEGFDTADLQEARALLDALVSGKEHVVESMDSKAAP